VHFVRAGAGTPPLVFVHGFGCSHEDWASQVQQLKNKYEVIACDLRGHGQTPGRPHECSIQHYGGDVAALIHHLELDQAVLVGHSMGCRVALEAARLDPERVAGVVFIDGSRTGTGDPDEAERSARAAIESAGYAAFAAPFFGEMFFEKSKASKAVIERALRLRAEIGSALFPKMARWDAERMEAALEAVRVPVMAIQTTYLDSQRKRVPLKAGQSTPWLDLLKKKLKNPAIEILPGLSHFPQLEAPERVNRLIEQLVSKTV
jgi:pimeloyl-ACP methyl ester carboxylesterase